LFYEIQLNQSGRINSLAQFQNAENSNPFLTRHVVFCALVLMALAMKIIAINWFFRPFATA
jgi:hypothetical protein